MKIVLFNARITRLSPSCSHCCQSPFGPSLIETILSASNRLIKMTVGVLLVFVLVAYVLKNLTKPGAVVGGCRILVDQRPECAALSSAMDEDVEGQMPLSSIKKLCSDQISAGKKL
ncbi:hypothetical protein QR680_015598 [Steinernema hermaphroditum]|uniref:Uncharacterized protein n=1 Tax=Steinernema hermaphroditum TaxID=289476 RepID=A0AA39LKW7_9BILA|nr:hypothetical protein QR680_015598 [Steinernema hermaphroditum]